MTKAMINQWQGAVVILLMFGMVMSALSIWQRRFRPEAETVRKILHITMGLFALSFPFFITSVGLGFVIAAAAIGMLIAVRKSVALRKRFGTVLGGVGRRSNGEMYFALGIAILFTLAKDDFLRYAIALLVLTFADAAAALIGVRFGKHFFRGAKGKKSVEGSLSFFIVATACIYGPLRLGINLPTGDIFIIAATMSLLLTLIEALSWHGLDNLFLPVGGHFLLTDFLHRNTSEILALLLFVMLFVITLFITEKRGRQYASHH